MSYHESTTSPCLIVNADDYAFFDCVSRGILDAIRAGNVTATGVMANATRMGDRIDALKRTRARFDVGVHLNLSWGRPLTAEMQAEVRRWNGMFPGKFTMATALMGGRIPVEAVHAEWSAQIERCIELELKPLFLNSHEHLHMLPLLRPMARRLATTFGIPFVRHVSPDPLAVVSGGGALRSAIVAGLSLVSPRPDDGTPRLLGLGSSGRLTVEYLRRALRRLKPGRAYELMCHPGRFDAKEIEDPRLVRYHDWESELRLLTSPVLRDMCAEQGIRMIAYRDLPVETPT